MNLAVLLRSIENKVDSLTTLLATLQSQVSAIQQRLEQQEARRESQLGKNQQGGAQRSPSKRY